jgi:hypothetical protein
MFAHAVRKGHAEDRDTKKAAGEGFEPSISDFKDRSVSSYTIPQKGR